MLVGGGWLLTGRVRDGLGLAFIWIAVILFLGGIGAALGAVAALVSI